MNHFFPIFPETKKLRSAVTNFISELQNTIGGGKALTINLQYEHLNFNLWLELFKISIFKQIVNFNLKATLQFYFESPLHSLNK